MSRIPYTHRLFCLLFAAILLASSCEEVFDPTMLSGEAQLVVISQFRPGEEVVVRVSRTRSVTDPQGIFVVDDADVSILIDTTVVAYLEKRLDDSGEVLYTSSDFIPEEGVLYTIVVEAPGFPSVSATSLIPELIPIKEINLGDVEVDSSGEFYTFPLSIRFQDPGSVTNYYHLNLSQEVLKESNGEVKTDIRRLDFDRVYDSRDRLTDLEGGLLLSDQTFDGEEMEIMVPVTIRIDPLFERLGDVQIELRSVTEEYYLFQSSIVRQTNSSINPLSEPTLLFNNVQNGQGIFAGYNSTSQRVPLNI
jgi:hypothetical protein